MTTSAEGDGGYSWRYHGCRDGVQHLCPQHREQTRISSEQQRGDPRDGERSGEQKPLLMDGVYQRTTRYLADKRNNRADAESDADMGLGPTLSDQGQVEEWAEPRLDCGNEAVQRGKGRAARI